MTAQPDLPPVPATVPWWRGPVVAVAVVRYVVPLLALPLIPVLLPERVALLVLLRPTKEFLVLGGVQYRLTGAPAPLLLLAAFVPLMVLAVWAFFAVGRAYRAELVSGSGPRWLRWAVPPRRLAVAQAVLDQRGPVIAVLGRFGGLPPTVLAAAAGASSVSVRRYLVADTVGAVASFAVMLVIGYRLGRTWEEGVTWLTLVGALLFVAVVVTLGRWFRVEAAELDDTGGVDVADAERAGPAGDGRP